MLQTAIDGRIFHINRTRYLGLGLVLLAGMDLVACHWVLQRFTWRDGSMDKPTAPPVGHRWPFWPGRAAWLSLESRLVLRDPGVAGRGVVGFVSGMVLTYVLLLILSSVMALLGDAAGWPSFGLSLGGLSFYRFHAGAGGEFYGELGSGIFFLALITGLLNAAALIRRGERQTPAGRQGV